MKTRRSLNPTQREALWDAERLAAQASGRGDFPICNLCAMPVFPGQEWDESHIGAPHALGGSDTGVAHRRCNRQHGAKVVTPMVAKAKRQRRRHIGAFVPQTKLPGGRDDPRKMKIGSHWPVDRHTGMPWRIGRGR